MKKKVVAKERINWIDTLRGLGMFFVVWGHCVPFKYPIRIYIYSFHMPLFFFISGLTFKDSDDMDLLTYTKKKFKGLIIPYIIFNMVCYILCVILYKVGVLDTFNYLDNFMGIFYSNGDVLPFPSSPSWFLITLFFTEILFYILKKHSTNDYNLFLAVIVFSLIGYANSLSEYQINMPWHLNSVFISLVFYFAGYLFMKNIKKFDFIFEKKYRMLISGAELGLLGLIFAFLNTRVSVHGNIYGSITLFYISAFATILGLVLFVRLFMNKSYVFKTIGKNTLFYLGYHLLLLWVLKHFLPQLTTRNINVLILTCIACAILFPLALFTKKYLPIIYGKWPDKAKN